MTESKLHVTKTENCCVAILNKLKNSLSAFVYVLNEMDLIFTNKLVFYDTNRILNEKECSDASFIEAAARCFPHLS